MFSTRNEFVHLPNVVKPSSCLTPPSVFPCVFVHLCACAKPPLPPPPPPVSTFEFRRTQYKAGIDADAARKTRERHTDTIRKQQKDEIISAKRHVQALPPTAAAFGLGPAVGAPPIPADAITPTKNLDPTVRTRVRVLLSVHEACASIALHSCHLCGLFMCE